MQASCKVSYSVLVHVERQGAQLEGFFEKFETPVEFLKDPSGWVDVEDMETFLISLGDYLGVSDKPPFYREIGRENFELRAWGVLDSVLKMVESPRDIFEQPERFLSYFLTPPPEFKIEKQLENQLSFTMAKPPKALNITSYLVGAVEGIPKYTGGPLAQIEFLGADQYQITWAENQESLFDEQEKKRRQFHPEIVHSVMESLRQHQTKAVETTQSLDGPQHIASEAFEKMVALEVEKRLETWIRKQKDFDESLFKIKNDFYKMYDYFTRAQQIITLISPTARKASVREAMRRVDWEHVQKEFPNMVESACDSILAMKDTFQITVEQNSTEDGDVTRPVDLNNLIENVVESLSFDSKNLKVDRNLHLDKKVLLEPKSFALALGDVFQNSLTNSHKEAEVKIVTRTSGGKVQIEISDTGLGYSSEKLEKLFDCESDHNLNKSQEIIKRHRGKISVSSRQGQGSTYLIELPNTL
jgi:hypothetical protein